MSAVDGINPPRPASLYLFTMNDENMLVIESADVARAYTTYFDALFAQYTKQGAPLPPT